MHEPLMTQSGMTRRQVLERGALIGGAVLAAQSLGTVAAFAQTSAPPPPPPPPPPATGTLPSNFQVVVGFGTGTYGVKYDSGGWDKIGKGTLCGFRTAFDTKAALPAGLLSALSAPGVVTVGVDPDGHKAYVLALPASVRFIEGRPKDGTCKSDPDKCGGHVERLSTGTYAFAACD